MKMPNKADFLDICKSMRTLQSEDIARFYFNNANEFSSFEQVSEATGYSLNKVRQTKYLLSHNYGFCFCYIGSSRNRSVKMIGVDENRNGFSISERDMIADKEPEIPIKIRSKKSSPMNIGFSHNKTGKLINSIFK